MRLFRLIDPKEYISYRIKVKIGTIPGHKTTSVFRRYNVVSDDELQDVKWINDENFGVHIGVHQHRKTREIG